MRPALQAGRRAIQYPVLATLHPQALAFYTRAMAGSYLPNEHIDIIPALGILYVAVPKAASTRVRSILAALIGRDTISHWRGDANWRVHSRKANGLQAPRHSVLDFYRVATDPRALRFSIVRNPYDRLVSCWEDQYGDKPLIPNDGYIARYLKHRSEVSEALPFGAGQTLSFPDFVRFTTATAARRIDRHWTPQSDILDIPGVRLNLVGKVETFPQDIDRVLNHVNTDDAIRREFIKPLHKSDRRPVSEYYAGDLADLVYRAYERDFDAYQYPRAVPS